MIKITYDLNNMKMKLVLFILIREIFSKGLFCNVKLVSSYGF